VHVYLEVGKELAKPRNIGEKDGGQGCLIGIKMSRARRGEQRDKKAEKGGHPPHNEIDRLQESWGRRGIEGLTFAQKKSHQRGKSRGEAQSSIPPGINTKRQSRTPIKKTSRLASSTGARNREENEKRGSENL